MIAARIKIVAASVLCASAAVCLAYVAMGVLLSRTAGMASKQVVLVAAVLQLATAVTLIIASRTNRG